MTVLLDGDQIHVCQVLRGEDRILSIKLQSTFSMMLVVIIHVSSPYNRTNCLEFGIEDCDFDVG